MNAEKVGRIVAGLEAGRRVLVVSRSWAESGQLLALVTSAAARGDGELAVRRTNGGQRLESPRTGGTVLFAAGGDATRGLSVDLLVLDEDLSDGAVANALPTVTASGGEVIR